MPSDAGMVDENIFSVLNLGNFIKDVEIDLPLDEIGLDSSKTYYLTDMLSGDYISGRPQEMLAVTAHFEPYQARIFVLADTLTIVNQLSEQKQVLTQTFRLNQNYPNPFNPQTTIAYELPQNDLVRLDIYNLLGQRVMTLVEGRQTAGAYQISFDGRTLASGVYIYRLQSGKHTESKKMILLR